MVVAEPLEQVAVILGKGQARRAVWAVAFLPVHFHVPVDVDFEHVLLPAAKVVPDCRRLPHHDVRSRPLVYVIQLKFHGVGPQLQRAAPHSCAQQQVDPHLHSAA